VAAKAVLDYEDCHGEDRRISEECLMRRTLAAHVDHIYTQKQVPKIEDHYPSSSFFFGMAIHHMHLESK